MTKRFIYRSGRPRLAIEHTGNKTLGNCYEASYYRVTSLWRLKLEQLQALRAAGFIGSGQYFTIVSKCDGSEEPAGHDEAPCVVEVDGKVTDEPAINELSGVPYKPIQQPYFVYEIDSRCDSSD